MTLLVEIVANHLGPWNGCGFYKEFCSSTYNSMRSPYSKILTRDMMSKQQHRTAKKVTNDTKIGWICDSNREKHKYNSKIQTVTWLPPQYTKWQVLKIRLRDICITPLRRPALPWGYFQWYIYTLRDIGYGFRGTHSLNRLVLFGSCH